MPVRTLIIALARAHTVDEHSLHDVVNQLLRWIEITQLQQDSDWRCRHAGISMCITRGVPEDGTLQCCGACAAQRVTQSYREHACTSESLLRKLASSRGVWLFCYILVACTCEQSHAAA